MDLWKDKSRKNWSIMLSMIIPLLSIIYFLVEAILSRSPYIYVFAVLFFGLIIIMVIAVFFTFPTIVTDQEIFVGGKIGGKKHSFGQIEKIEHFPGTFVIIRKGEQSLLWRSYFIKVVDESGFISAIQNRAKIEEKNEPK